MENILIFGNSGSGKSTLAKKLADENNLAHLDLDILAWLPSDPPERAPIKESEEKIQDFLSSNQRWVIEGGYVDLLELLMGKAKQIVFLNLDAKRCVENARNRPWEPHKYASMSAQDKNLSMLIDWIKEYENRNDEFSYNAHMNFYQRFSGEKVMYTDNNRGV